MAWSIAALSIALGSSGRLLGDGDARGCRPTSSGTPFESEPPVLAEIVEEARDRARVAAALRALALELVDLLDDVDRDDDVVVLEPEDRVRVVEQDVRVEDVVLLHRYLFTVGEVRGQVAAAALDAMRRVRLIGAATPVNAEPEIERLVAAFEAGDPTFPQWVHRPEHTTVPEIRGAHEIVRARLDELRLEAAMAEAVGTPAFAPLAAERFREPASAIRAADRTARAWSKLPSTTEDELVRTDASDPRSLLSQVRAAIGRARAPFSVRVSTLGALAATGEHTVYVARGRFTTPLAARRIALHEVQGHVMPRVRARRSNPIFELGTARGTDEQEGLAVLYEERAGFLDDARRVDLARRHLATRAMRDGADFVEVTRALATMGASCRDAIMIATRVFRGSNGRFPGLGRESVYITSFSRVRAHLAKHPADEVILASGQIAILALQLVRQLPAGRHADVVPPPRTLTVSQT